MQQTDSPALQLLGFLRLCFRLQLFVAWKVSSPYVSTAFSTEATYTFTVTESIVDTTENPPLLFLYAVFQEVQQIVPTYEINCVAHNLSSNETGGKVFLETDKGGTGYATSQQQYATENATVRLRAVAEPGYQFVAWRKGSPTDANATVSTNAEYEFTATEAVWMYAIFEYTPNCTIECIPFDITGGINNGQNNVGGTVSIQTDKGTASGTITQSLKATRNSSVTVNAVAASGYEFLGWKKASPYVQAFVATTASYTFDINEELYLYAVFQQVSTPEYIVAYSCNGGSGTMVGDMVKANGKFTLEECTYEAPEGYKFKAWAIGNVNGEQKQPGEQITITGETYIYAIWEEAEVLLTGWQLIEGTWYYYDDANQTVKGWLNLGGTWYYFNNQGAMQTGWQFVGSSWYYFAEGGNMVTGWQYINNTWYYFGPSGNMLTGWQYLGSSWYYFAEGGNMVTGWQYIGSSWYYFNAGGNMATGWLLLGNTWYYLAEGGNMVTGWQYIGSSWYYFNAGGNMATGWLLLGNTWYYLAEGGAMLTGWQYLGGNWYYFNAGGAWVA